MSKRSKLVAKADFTPMMHPLAGYRLTICLECGAKNAHEAKARCAFADGVVVPSCAVRTDSIGYPCLDARGRVCEPLRADLNKMIDRGEVDVI